MGKLGQGYGSEYHFRGYRGDPQRSTLLDHRLLEGCGKGQASRITWIYPGDKRAREPRGLDFLTDRLDVLRKWQTFWPQRGMPPNWDGIARIDEGPGAEWLLTEVKANHCEFCSSPCQASVKGGRSLIERSLNRVKKALGVHRHFPWLGTYYQHANRLAVLYLLQAQARVPARLVEVFITGDSFPDKRACPQDQGEWEPLIEARRLTLGLPKQHPLSEWISRIYLPVLPSPS